MLAGHLALIGVQLCFGLFPLLGKRAFEGFDPPAVAAWRIGAGAAILGVVALLVHGRGAWPARRDLLRLQACALLGVALNQVLFLTGLRQTTTVHVGLMMMLIPVFTYASAVAVRQERFAPHRALGIGLACAGTAALVWDGFTASWGNLLIIANTLSFSWYLVISRPLAGAIRRWS